MLRNQSDYYHLFVLQAFVSEAIDAVRDLEETEFAAEPRDAKVIIDADVFTKGYPTSSFLFSGVS